MANLMRWEPFRDMISIREAMNHLFEESLVQPRTGWVTPVGTGSLAVDMYELDDTVVVKSTIPGIKAEDLDVSITGDVLTIKGETKVDEEIEEANYVYRERRHGSFCRALTIPVPVVTDEIEAEFENGVLTLTLPKAEEIKPKAIKVRAGASK
jgi:HSP20 family protein